MMAEVIRLGQENCRDCYKCIRDCLLKAIRYSDGHAEIMQQECIQCGECVVTCPRHIELDWNDLKLVRRQIRIGRKVVASVSPSFIADMDVGDIEDLREAMLQLGFADVQESAMGAELVSREYERLMQEERMPVVISSACPPIIKLMERYYPDLLKYLAPVKSPMEVHSALLRKQYPDAFVVFVGPCYARKGEQLETNCCDAMLLFSDLKKWMHEAGVRPINRGIRVMRGGMRSRRYARRDGIVKSMTRIPGWNRVAVDGINDCIAALEELRQGGISRVFVEMSSCIGSCVNGPAIRFNRYENRVSGTVMVNSYAGENDFHVPQIVPMEKQFHPMPIDRTPPTENEVERVLEKMDKATADKALNCGCCGYPSCRAMASALCQGKAQIEMCLPYLHEKAERHSREIVDNTLEAADQVIDRQMRVVQNIASILGETTAETKIMLSRLKEAIQGEE